MKNQSMNKDKNPRTSGGFLYWQIISTILIIYDFIAVNIVFFAALWMRFDCRFTLIPDSGVIRKGLLFLSVWMKHCKCL